MYEQFFGLKKAPFKITPDPEFFFPGGNRGAVLEALVYALSRGEGIVKVVGEVGSGKTMLCRMLQRELPDNCDIVYLANPRLSPDDILHAIAFELDLKAVSGKPKIEVLHALQDYLLEKYRQDRRVIMFIEEAQGVPLETLEEIRLLSNLETSQDKLLQIVMFGQPELDENLGAHEIRQLNERITHRFELMPLKVQEIRDYVNMRLRESGFRGNALFSDGAVRAIAKHSKGLLRRINILADKALLAGFANGDRLIEPRHVRLAARDSDLYVGLTFKLPALRIAATAGGIVLMAMTYWTVVHGPLAGYGSDLLNTLINSESSAVENRQGIESSVNVRSTPKVARMLQNTVAPNKLLSDLDLINVDEFEFDTVFDNPLYQ